MKLQEVFALLASLIAIPMSAWYARLAWTGKSAPPLSTWLIFTATVTLSFPSYLLSGKKDLLGAISNMTDLFAVWSALIAILASQGLKALRFSKTEMLCLLAIGKICVGWAFVAHFFDTRTASIAAYWSIQGIMVLAYWPTISRLWESESPTEPLGPWVGILLSMALGFLAALAGRNYLAALYPLRAVAMVSIVLIIIGYKRRKLLR